MDRTLAQYNPSTATKSTSSSTKKTTQPRLQPCESTSSQSTIEEPVCLTSRTDSCVSYTQSYSNSQPLSVDLSNNESVNNFPTQQRPSNNNNGLFDRFLKNYTSSSSIQDEPDMSFVSSQGQASNQVSPNKLLPHQITHHSYSSSGISSNPLAHTNQSMDQKTMENSSLIQFQQRQLMHQFADMSSIDGQAQPLNISSSLVINSQDNNSTGGARSLAMTRLDETKFDLMVNRSDLQSTKIAASQNCTKSMMLLSPGNNLTT